MACSGPPALLPTCPVRLELSQQLAYAARSLQALLSSWNPARRQHGVNELDIGGKSRATPAWIHFDTWEHTRAPQPRDILTAYFHGFKFPPAAYDILKAAPAEEWTHPMHACKLPLCARAVILRELGAATGAQDIDAAVCVPCMALSLLWPR